VPTIKIINYKGILQENVQTIGCRVSVLLQGMGYFVFFSSFFCFSNQEGDREREMGQEIKR